MSSIIEEIYRSTHHAEHQRGVPILDLCGVTMRYETGVVLDNIDLKLQSGEKIAVVGPNGAGKSTMFKIIAGVLAPTRGSVNVFGQGPGGHICIAYLPQRSHVDWHFPVSVADVVMMGRVGKVGLLRWPRRKDWEIVFASLEEVGLASFAQRQISELSGGQQQRMFIARALAQEAELMLMDEPFSGLDIRSEDAILPLLDRLRQRGITILLSTHDLNQAAEKFDQVILLNRSILGFGSPQEVFTTELLLRAYGGHLHLMKSTNGMVIVGDTCCDEAGLQ